MTRTNSHSLATACILFAAAAAAAQAVPPADDLLPEARVGFYVAHSTSDPALADAFLAAFLDRYFPRPVPTPENLGGPVDEFAGTYAWREGSWTVAGRVHFSLVVAAAILFLPFLWHWRLLGFWC